MERRLTLPVRQQHPLKSRLVIGNIFQGCEFSYYTETQLLWLVSDLFIAGGETTITTIRWILLCLAKYPQGQERVRQEIINAFGRDSTPT